jgi:hypothetical protein
MKHLSFAVGCELKSTEDTGFKAEIRFLIFPALQRNRIFWNLAAMRFFSNLLHLAIL